MMDWRTVLAMALMMVIMYLAFPPGRKVPSPATNSLMTASNPISPESSTEKKVDSNAKRFSSALATRNFNLSNDLIEIELNGLGAIKKVAFKKYGESVSDQSPLEVTFPGPGLNEFNLMVIGQEPEWTLAEQSSSHLLLKATVNDSVAERRISLNPGEYAIRVTDRILNRGERSIEASLQTNLVEALDPEKKSGFFKRMFFPQSEFQALSWNIEGSTTKKMAEQFEKTPREEITQNLSWLGFTSRYFLYGLVPGNTSTTSTELILDDQKAIHAFIKYAPRQVSPASENSFEYSLYLGPKRIPDLEKISPTLTRSIDYGNWIGPIARLLLRILLFFYSLVPNFGIAIILLTFLVKILLFPLAYKAAYSMRKLQLVAPKLKEIREKYKGDQQRQSAEMMSLYKTEKVNPFGGCLPILAQLPVFFSLYRVFFASIEMRHEAFVFWIKDLSTFDPYFVTPILMVALMTLQQRITPMPNAGDEENETVRIQRQMFKWMPLIFGGIMIFLPSGLTLYFVVNSALSIAQQYWMNRRLDVLLPRPAANPASASG